MSLADLIAEGLGDDSIPSVARDLLDSSRKVLMLNMHPTIIALDSEMTGVIAGGDRLNAIFSGLNQLQWPPALSQADLKVLLMMLLIALNDPDWPSSCCGSSKN